MLASVSLCAQNDNFFNRWNEIGNGLDEEEPVDLPVLPGEHGGTGDVSAPLGTGLLILTAFGAGYALRKSNRQ